MVESTAAYRYANMTNDEAIAELDKRGLPYVIVDPVPGVRAPIRLTARLHGVLIHSGLAPNQRATSPFEILDARLALALDDFTAILEKHDIDEIEHFSMYRPNVAKEIPAPKQQAAPAPPKAKEQAPTEVVPAKPEVAPTKPTEQAAKPAVEPPAPSKVAVRSKPQVPRKPTKKQAKGPWGKPATHASKTTPPKQPVVAHANPAPAMSKTDKLLPPAPVPEKGASKAGGKHLGKADLGQKSSTVAAPKGMKQKAPGETDETVSPDKHAEVVTEPAPKKDDAPQMVQNPAWAAPGTRHPGGLAIDVGKLHKKDGTWITVLGHFQGKIGDRACGIDAPVPAIAEARELRALVCEAMDQHVFTYVLTPNYNAAHADHFHMEIKPGVKWFMVH